MESYIKKVEDNEARYYNALWDIVKSLKAKKELSSTDEYILITAKVALCLNK